MLKKIIWLLILLVIWLQVMLAGYVFSLHQDIVEYREVIKLIAKKNKRLSSEETEKIEKVLKK